MSASNTIEQWIYDTLSTAIPGTAVYSHIAPTDAEYPYILFSQISGKDVSVNDAYRVQTNFQYLIKVVTQGQPLSSLDTIVDAVYTALHAQSTTTGIQACIATAPYTATEVADDTYYSIRGHFFRISA